MEISTLGGGEDEDGNEIEGEEGDPEMARGVFERGYKDLRAKGEKEDVSVLQGAIECSSLVSDIADIQRALLLEAWKSFEEQHGDETTQAHVQEMLPTTRKRWRKAEDGSGALEEYWDIAFPDDERDANPSTFKFFQAAQNWAAQRDGAGAGAIGGVGVGGGGLSYEMPDDSDDEDEEDEDEDEAGEKDGDAEGDKGSDGGKSDGRGEAMDQDGE